MVRLGSPAYSCLQFDDMHDLRPVIVVGRDENNVARIVIQISIGWMKHRYFGDINGDQNTQLY